MIGNRLKIVREHRGHTQRSLAELLGVGEKQIWRYENEQTSPSGKDVARIADFLEVSSDFLLGLSDDPAPYSQMSQGGETLTQYQIEVLTRMKMHDEIYQRRVAEFSKLVENWQ